ncbi:hypothetical protein E0I94_35405, partial [Rhizobium laguerreae]
MPPILSALRVPSTSTKSAPPLAGSAGCFAILDPCIPPWPRAASFTNVKETTMTTCIDEVIALLQAELRNADPT